MLVDVHVHVSPPEMVSNRTAFLDGEPGLSLLYSDPKARLVSTTELLADMDNGGVDQALVMGFPWQNLDHCRRYHDWLLKECQKSPRLRPLAAFDPRAPWALKEAEDFFKSGGYGLGELCVYDEGLTPSLLDNLEALGQLCQKYQSPILIHVNEPIGHKYPGKAPMEIGQIFDLVRRLQNTKLILAHFGGGLPFLATLRREVREFLDLTRFDTAAMPFIFTPQALRLAVDILGPSSFLLGTDYPLLKSHRYLKYFMEAGLTDPEVKQIVGQAAVDFLGL